MTSTNSQRSSGSVTPMSLPYAPVSSEVSQISTTPSSKLCTALATISAMGYEPSSPRACFVLQ